MSNGAYADQTIKCKDCGGDFIFTGDERAFFEERQFHPPQRCKACRALKKAQAAK